LNRSIGRSPRFGGIDSLQEYNIHGIFKASYFECLGTKESKLMANYVTCPQSLPPKPGGNTKWYRNIVSLVSMTPNTRHNSTAKQSVPVGLLPTKTIELAPTQKRRRGTMMTHNQSNHQPNHHQMIVKQ
jgi:hypothetical protein